jgi:hypothetical protein
MKVLGLLSNKDRYMQAKQAPSKLVEWGCGKGSLAFGE